LGPTHPDTLKAMMSLSVSYSSAGRHDEALKLRLETVELMRKTLGPDHPHTLIGLNNLASCYEQLGQHEEALKLREETLRLRKAKLGPDHPEIILSMGNVAFSLVTLHRDDEAVNTIDDCIQRSAGKTVDPRVVPWLMDLRLRVFQKKNDAAGCRDTARRWENLNRTDAENLYTAACMRAVTDAVIRAGDKSQDAARQADAESDQAMIWLKQALAAGYDKFDHMRKDKDLDALRERDDFERLLATHPTTRQEIKGP
ncbi:MAG: tetratricopeptide repeat protein, partial [Tepidisphaeraceae bacterium]